MVGSTTDNSKAPGPRSPNASLVKSLRVLEELGDAGGVATVAELVRRTELDRTTVQRVLRTLHGERYLQRIGRGEYAIASRGYFLGRRLGRGDHLALTAEPVLARLLARTGEAVHLAVLDGTDVECVARLDSGKMLAFNFPVGARIPAFCSSLGRAILSQLPPDQAELVLKLTGRQAFTEQTITSMKGLRQELEHVRQQGYSVVESEVERGVSSAAAPVTGPGGEAVAAINVVVPQARIDSKNGLDVLIEAVITEADSLSRELVRAS